MLATQELNLLSSPSPNKDGFCPISLALCIPVPTALSPLQPFPTLQASAPPPSPCTHLLHQGQFSRASVWPPWIPLISSICSHFAPVPGL